MILRTRGECYATATPDRATAGTSTSTTCALLAPRTLATTGHIGAGFLLFATLTTAGHVGDDCLVHQRLVELTTKGAIGDFDGLCAIYIQLHVNPPLTASLGGRTHEHVTTSGTGHCALHQKQIPLSIDTHDFQRLHGYALGAHVPGHLLALEYTTWGLALTDRARDAVGYGVTVGIVLTTEVPALDGTGEAFTLGLTGDIHHLPSLENLSVDLVTSLELLAIEAEFPDATTSSNIRFSEVTGLSLGNTARATLADSDLHCTIAIALFILELSDAIRLDLDDRNRNRDTILGENAGHTAFATDYTNSHFETS